MSNRKISFKNWRAFLSGLSGLTFLVLSSGHAHAHVKWFAPYNVAAQPRPLTDVIDTKFLIVSLIALVIYQVARFVERSPIGVYCANGLKKGLERANFDLDLIMRASWGFFLVSLWNVGGTILTPELKTDLSFVPWLQLAAAGCLILSQTRVLAAMGLVFLFFLAMANYGLFHMADYPVFLGVAAYLILKSLDEKLFGLRPLDLLRWSAAITLMWASVEKWAYPQWTYALLDARPELTMGLDKDMFMVVAGIIEFGLAFGLISSPLIRWVSSVILCFLFTIAIPMFGKIDAIGHAPIIGILVAVAFDPALIVANVRRTVNDAIGSKAVVAFINTTSALMIINYIAHKAMFGTAIFA